MTDREQIEDMARKLRAYCYDLVLTDKDDCERLADFIVGTLGYRKQVEAKWHLVCNGFGVCKNCNRMDAIDPISTHCRYCGAKMKGGE